MSHYEGKREPPRRQTHQDAGSAAPRGEGGQPPRRRRRRRMGALGALFYVVLVIGVSALLAGLGWIWAGDVLALNKTELTATITLPDDIFTYSEETNEEGETVTVSKADVDYVADQLKQNGIIEYKWLFQLFCGFTGGREKMMPGTYTLSTSMDYSAIIRNLSAKSSARTEVTVVIPEGSTLAQIFAILEENGVATVEELNDAAANHDFNFSFLKDVLPLGEPTRLEGYLFPDTYIFYQNMDPVQALNKMILRFDEVFTDDMREAAAANGQTIHDIVIIASMIEKETTGNDQTDIAEVIYNRLYNPTSETAGYLNIDATIQYILPERKDRLTAEDLAIDSPYNTYLYTGLPAGPIASPGQASLRAAMNPSGSGYYFYALGDDGEHHFFRTYQEQENFRATQELYQNG